jgi:hypothetical protein
LAAVGAAVGREWFASDAKHVQFAAGSRSY